MGYKYKPCKAVAKRFKVSKTGKLKRHHCFTSHLMSSRAAKRRRRLRQPEILFEGHARNMRKFMGISGKKPNQAAHQRALASREHQQPETTEAPKSTRTAGVAASATTTPRR